MLGRTGQRDGAEVLKPTLSEGLNWQTVFKRNTELSEVQCLYVFLHVLLVATEAQPVCLIKLYREVLEISIPSNLQRKSCPLSRVTVPPEAIQAWRLPLSVLARSECRRHPPCRVKWADAPISCI